MTNEKPNLPKPYIDEIVLRLRKRTRKAQFWGWLYWILNDWFYAISWISAIIAPFGFALIAIIPEQRHELDITMLVITGIGTVLSLIRTVFRMGDRAKNNVKTRTHAQYLVDQISLGRIDSITLPDELKKLGLTDIDEPQPC